MTAAVTSQTRIELATQSLTSIGCKVVNDKNVDGMYHVVRGDQHLMTMIESSGVLQVAPLLGTNVKWPESTDEWRAEINDAPWAIVRRVHAYLRNSLLGVTIIDHATVQYRHIRVTTRFKLELPIPRNGRLRGRWMYFVHAYDCCYPFYSLDEVAVNLARDCFEQGL